MRRALGMFFAAGMLLLAPSAHAVTLEGGALGPKSQDSALVHVDLSPKETSALIHSSWVCGKHYYDITSRAEGTRHGNALHYSGSGTIRLNQGRARFRTDLQLRLSDEAAAGTLSISGSIHSLHDRTCKPQRVAVRLRRPAIETARGARPEPNTKYYGNSVLRTVKGKAYALWTTKLNCYAVYGGTAHDESLQDYTPKMAVARSGRFHEKQKYSLTYSDVIYHYSVHYGGRFTRDGAHGSAGARLHIVDRATGKTFVKCSGGILWNAVRTDAHTTIPSTTHRTARDWQLDLNGTTVGSPQILGVSFNRRRLNANVSTTDLYLSLGIDAGGGRTLEPGKTYTDRGRRGPQLAVAGLGDPCQAEPTGQFTVTGATYDLAGFPKTYTVSFTQNCGGSILAGTLRFSR